jgi:hypothetical protein
MDDQAILRYVTNFRVSKCRDLSLFGFLFLSHYRSTGQVSLAYGEAFQKLPAWIACEKDV